jgi:hypothetical protein
MIQTLSFRETICFKSEKNLDSLSRQQFHHRIWSFRVDVPMAAGNGYLMKECLIHQNAKDVRIIFLFVYFFLHSGNDWCFVTDKIIFIRSRDCFYFAWWILLAKKSVIHNQHITRIGKYPLMIV